MSKLELAKPNADEATLIRFGYFPQLRRTLKPWAVLGIAFSFMSITTSIYVSFGFGLGKFGPASIWLWPAVVFGQLLVALIVAELGSRIPLAGYSYQWGARLIGTGYGWLIAFISFAYLVTCCATISYILIAPFIGALLGTTLSSLQSVSVAIATLVFTAVVNVAGVKLFARINSVAVVAEVIAVIAVAALVVIAYVLHPNHPVTFLFNTGGVHGGGLWAGIAGALVMGLFSMTGFEAAADMSEEAVGATGSVPKAVIGSLLASGIVGFVSLVGLALAVPDIAKIANSSLPVLDIVSYWFGGNITRALVVFPLVAVFGSVLSVMAVMGRLLFALARDNVAPGSGLLRRVKRETQVPAVALWVSMAAGTLMLIYAYFQGDMFNILVGATSILPYVVYLLLIGAYAWKRGELNSLHAPGTFTLGRWAAPVFTLAFLWLIAALLMLTVPQDFHQADFVVAVVIVVALAWYALALRGRVRAGHAGVAQVATEQPAAAGNPS